MGAAAEFDIGPLTWVKGEIEQALAKAGGALAAYLADSSSLTQLKFCKTHLHQAHGALEIVGLEGVTRLTEECERMIEAAESGGAAIDAARGAALALVFEALPVYLNELADGAPHQPVRLFPAYRAVMQARGAERIAESDLFFPDLSARPPQREAAAPPADMREHVQAQRRRFQSGLLRWLRNPADAAAQRDMAEAVRAIERTQALPQHRAFWWITTGFAETLQDAGGGVDLDVKRLCARIDMQMKRLMEGSQNVAQRLMRDALYYVAKSRSSGAAVKELRAFYRLEGVVPNALAPAPGTHPQEAALRAIREILGAAKEKWNKFSAGQTHELSGFRDQAALLKEKTAALGHAEFARLVNAISVVTLWVAENPSKVTEPVAIETATALLLAENAVDNFSRLGDEFAGQVAAMGARLKASLAGQTPDVHAVPLLDEMSRKAQERLLMAQVVSEIKSNLGGIETALDAFFRDDTRRAELPGLERHIRQVLGALTILGSDQAVAALKGCQADIARFCDPGYVTDQADFERVANTLSGLGFFVDALQHGPADFDAVVRPVGARAALLAIAADDAETSAAGGAATAGAVGASVAASGTSGDTSGSTAGDTAGGTVEAELEQERKDARALFDAWREQPQDAVLTAELKATLEAIKSDADLVDEPTLRLSASDMLVAIQQAGHAHMDALDQTMARIAPAAPVPAAAVAAPVAAAVAAAPEEAVDAELLAIFLEEAQEVLETIGQQHALTITAPGNQETLITIRRAFHTLKGSGRMVGLMRFGEAAWAVEQTMNQWQQENKPAGAGLLGLISAGRELFTGWVADLSASGVSQADSAPLIAAAKRLQAGQSFEAAVPVAGATPAHQISAAPTMPAMSEGAAAPGGTAAPVAAPLLLTVTAASAVAAASAMRAASANSPASTIPAAPAVPALPAAPAPPAVAAAGQAESAAEAVDTAQSAATTEIAKAAAPGLDQTIVIGNIRVGRGLYAIFIDEATGHLATIGSEVGLLEFEPQPPRDELVRAAHTLAGIAGTVNFTRLHELARAFERMLLAARSGGVVLAGGDLLLAREARTALDAMLQAVRELRAPVEADQLQTQLDLRRAQWATAGDTADALFAGLALPDARPQPAPFAAAPEVTPAATADALGFIDAPVPVVPLTAASAPVPGLGDTTIQFAAGSALAAALAQNTAPAALSTAVPTTTPAPVPGLGDTTIQFAAGSALAAALAQSSAPAASSSAAPAPATTNDLPPAGTGLPADEELLARGFDPAERRQERIDDEIDDQLLPIFLEEANELMPRISAELRSWAGGGNVQELQRALHTLKGGARMAGAMALGQLTHSMETRVENALRLPHIPAPIFEGLFSSYDRTAMLVDSLRQSGQSGSAPVGEPERTAVAQAEMPGLVPAFGVALAAAAALNLSGSAASSASVAATAAAPSPAPVPAQAPARAAARVAEDARAVLRVRADVIDRLVNEAGEVVIARSRIEGEMRAVKSSLKDLTENLIRLRAQLREIEIAAESQMQSRQREVEEKHGAFDPLEFDRFSRFQEITRMMAESVNDVATVQQALLKNVDEADAALLAQGRLSKDLQNDLMRVRTVPFNNVAERLYRVVRQTAKELGKRANLDIKGTQTEIDRSVLERMTGPFEHLLRNAIAHGLEEPQARVAAGKQEIGQIGLSARQEGNEFVLVFEDDGRGLDIARIRAKAIANGLMQEGDQLADQQIAEFIFASGFSTASEISEVSGRGVGMDVVRAEVAALGGRVEIAFTPGQGSRFTIYLPLTLAVTQVVLIRAGTHVYAVPSAMVEQVRQIKAGELDQARAAGKVEWMSREYPLHFLPRLLGDTAHSPETQRFTPVLLLRSGTLRAAIHVDEMLGNQEVVVKNIGPQLARVAGIAGATVLGTGQIVLILNPVPLASVQMALSMAAQAAAPVTALLVPAQQAAEHPAGSAQPLAEQPGAAVAVQPVAVQLAAVPPVAAVPLARAQPSVMVVDDSLTVRKITSRLLTRENYRVLTAKDGVDAIEQLQELRPDVMLVDVEMPRMDGFDLTRNVRADARLKDIPIIMITSRTADKHRNYAMEIGVNVFLGKPYQEEQLLEHIDYLVKNRADPTRAE